MEDSKGNSNSTNMEALISKVSFDLVEEDILDENDINKLLGVLANDGVYAMWVYAISKFGEEKTKRFINKISNLSKYIGHEIRKDDEASEKWSTQVSNDMIEISKDLNKLLLLKQILERTLIYARYYAKTLEGKGNEEDE